MRSKGKAPGPIDKSDAKKIPQPTSRTKTGCEDEEALEDASGVCKQDEYGSGSLSSQPASEGHNTSLSPREAGRSPMSMNRDMYNSRASRGDGQIHGVNNCSGVPLRAPKGAYSPEDFELRSLYGHGSYSEVWKVALKATGEEYALKIMKISHIRKENKEDYVKMERLILDSLDHPGVVRLLFTFRTDSELCMGMEACDGGELFYRIQQKGKLTVEEARFYAAELVDVLEYVHQYLVHRDIKPENLLLTSDGHLKLIDFGSAKLFRPLPSSVYIRPKAEDTSSGSFVGTAEYVSPEVVKGEPVNIGADLWALGCVIYQMLEGTSPFKAASEFLSFQKVASREFEFPSHFPPAARDLIDRLLDLEPGNRPGAGALGYAALKSHPFFTGVDWSRVREAVPPLFPKRMDC